MLGLEVEAQEEPGDEWPGSQEELYTSLLSNAGCYAHGIKA